MTPLTPTKRETLARGSNIAPIRPWARDCAPSWSGPRQSDEDRGYLFATSGARGSTVLHYDRADRNFALTVYGPVGSVIEHDRMLWKVKRLPERVGGFPNEAA